MEYLLKIRDTIKNLLFNNFPSNWDGKHSILELKTASEADGQNHGWKQMEWIGFYFEWKARKILINNLGGSTGPRFGSVVFDYQYQGIWDFKSHPNNQTAEWSYLNDVQSVNECIDEHGHLGWIIADGRADYDNTGDFKIWHDRLKGKISGYELERIRRGARSRKRKKSFFLENIYIIEFTALSRVKGAMQQGWLRNDMQAGQRNADGSSRNAKYGINLKEYFQSLNET